MNKNKAQLKEEIRYAIRLFRRQARFYRFIQWTGTTLSIIGGSAIFSVQSTTLPHWLSFTGAALLGLSGALLIGLRPADKAAANEADVKRYQTLMVKAVNWNEVELETAIEEARQSDTAEIEALRNVAFNDVMREINRDDQLIPLTPSEKIMGLLA